MKRKIIDEMLASNRKLFIAVTGGGSSAITQLTEEGGSSNVFLGAVIPYNTEELSCYVGSHGKSVSREVALLLSGVLYNRSSVDSLEEGVEAVGIGCTSSLVKKGGEREGREHKVCLAASLITADKLVKREYVEVTLKEKRTRKQEEDIVAELILLLADVNLCLRKAHPFNRGAIKNTDPALGLTVKDEVKWEPINNARAISTSELSD